MRELVRSVAIAAARLDAWSEQKQWRERLPAFVYMPLAVLPVIVSGARQGAGLAISLVAGFVLTMGAMFGLPWYGRRLLGTPSRKVLTEQRTAACRRLLDAVADQLDPQRVADATLILDADLPDEAMKLVLEDLGKLATKPDAAVLELVASTAQSVGIDKETRSLLAALGCVA